MKPHIQKARENLKETKQEVFFQTASLINSAFALVAALAWNDAIKAIIDAYLPAGSSLYSHLVYALVLTILVVLISMRLAKVIKRYQPASIEEPGQ